MDQTFVNLIDRAPAALNAFKYLASAVGNDANYAATVQAQLSNKADKAATYAKDQSDIQMGLRMDPKNAY